MCRSICWWCSPWLSQNPLPSAGWKVVYACYMIQRVLSEGSGWVFETHNTVPVRLEESACVWCQVLAAVKAVSIRPGSHTAVLFRILPGFVFWFEDRGQRALLACVFLPQLAVPAQRTFGHKNSACQNFSLGHNLLIPDSLRLSSGLQKPLHIFLCGMMWTRCQSLIYG